MSIFTNFEIHGDHYVVYKKHGTMEDVLAFLEGHNKAMSEVEPHAETFDIDYWRVLLEELGQRGFKVNDVYIGEDGYGKSPGDTEWSRGDHIFIDIPYFDMNTDDYYGCHLQLRFENFIVYEFDKFSNWFGFFATEGFNSFGDFDELIGEFPSPVEEVADAIEREAIGIVKELKGEDE